MAESDSEITLELALNKATSPALREEDWDLIHEFCDHVNKELEGPQTAVRLLAHKIQSPQERESLYALSTVEACVKQCGKRFHNEIGKFRFLNEIIKVISPKYLGGKTTEKVKKKCIELMYSWHKGLPSEVKITDAYKMLKQQGIVKEDPTYIDKNPLVLEHVPERPRNASFEDDEKSKLLSKLLKSKNPEDLQAANRLIKNMVKQDNERMERTSRRINELETILNNAKLLNEMLENFSPGTTTESEKEMMHELHESLQKLRPKLFRLASETDEKDNDGLSDILKANDEVTQVMSTYKQKVEGISQNGQGEPAPQKGGSSLLDLNFDQSASSKSVTSHSAEPKPELATFTSVDDELLTLGMKTTSTPSADHDTSNLLSDLDDIFSSSTAQPQQTQPTVAGIPQAVNQPMGQVVNPMMGMNQPMGQGVSPNMGFNQPMGQPASSMPGMNQTVPGMTVNPVMGQQNVGMQKPVNNMYSGSVFNQPVTVNPQQQSAASGFAGLSQPALSQQQMKAIQDLDAIGENLLQQSLGDKPPAIPPPPAKIPLSQMVPKTSMPTIAPPPASVGMANTANPAHIPPVSTVAGAQSPSLLSSPSTPKSTEVLPLTNLFVPLDKIQPGTALPVTAYEKNGLKVLIHVAKDRPREDVSVMVVSVMSTNTSPIKSFIFQAAVPKVMKVKLQPPSATDLPAFNPILPPAAITQVMLLANPQKEKIRLKFKVNYMMNDQTLSDVGDVDTIEVQ